MEPVLVLLASGVVVGYLVRACRALQAKAAESRREITRLHRVADLIAHDAQPAEILFACERELTELLALDACTFEPGPQTSERPRLERTGMLSGGSLRFVGGGFALPAEAVDLPVLHRGQRVGSFVLVPGRTATASLERRLVSVAIADQAGAALGADPILSDRHR